MKQKLSLLMVPVVMLSICSCSRNFDNTLPMKKTEITVTYFDYEKVELKEDIFTEKYRYQLHNTLNIDLKSNKFYDKDTKKRMKKEPIVGDILEVYYKDDTHSKIDHILVDKTEINKCKWSWPYPNFPSTDLESDFIAVDGSSYRVDLQDTHPDLLKMIVDDTYAYGIGFYIVGDELVEEFYVSHRPGDVIEKKGDIKGCYFYNPR